MINNYGFVDRICDPGGDSLDYADLTAWVQKRLSEHRADVLHEAATSELRVRTAGSTQVHEAVRTRFGLLLPACGTQGQGYRELPTGTPLTCPFCNGTEQPMEMA